MGESKANCNPMHALPLQKVTLHKHLIDETRSEDRLGKNAFVYVDYIRKAFFNFSQTRNNAQASY